MESESRKVYQCPIEVTPKISRVEGKKDGIRGKEPLDGVKKKEEERERDREIKKERKNENVSIFYIKSCPLASKTPKILERDI